jgi:hypothetical protein
MSVFTNAVNELLRLQGELDSRLRGPGSELFFGPSARRRVSTSQRLP